MIRSIPIRTFPLLQNAKSCRHASRSHIGFYRLIHIEKRLEELGLVLPVAPSPKANYNIVCYTNNNMLYISGHLPIKLDGTLMTGRIGPEASGGQSIPHGYEAARYVGLNIISTLKHQLGDLDRVEQIVKVCYYVSLPDFFFYVFFLLFLTVIYSDIRDCTING